MDPILGEIRAVGFSYAPRGWALCQGQSLSITQNTALFSLLGTIYGGDGRTTFGLPDLRGRLVVNAGQGPGLARYVPGQTGGTETVGLALGQLPAHTHSLAGLAVHVNPNTGNGTSPAGTLLAATDDLHYSSSASTQMGDNAVTGNALPIGSSAGHPNLMPYLPLSYIIALQGVYPSRP